MSSGVHKHRSPVDGEGVSPYELQYGANWMFNLPKIRQPANVASMASIGHKPSSNYGSTTKVLDQLKSGNLLYTRGKGE